MSYFLVIGVGPQASGPIEHVASTAIEAELHYSRLRRLCGKAGNVEVWTKAGRRISPDRLDCLVRAERFDAASLTTEINAEVGAANALGQEPKHEPL